MIEIKYQYPISDVADLKARLMLGDVAASDWETMAAYEIEEIHAGYEFEFPDTAADAVQFSSVSQQLADEQGLPSIESSGLTPEQIAELLRAAGLIQVPVDPTNPNSSRYGYLEIKRGDDNSIIIPTRETVEDAAYLWITLKNNYDEPDLKSRLQVTAVGGINVVNGAETADSSLGHLEAVEGSNAVLLEIDKTIAAQLYGKGVFDVQKMTPGGSVRTVQDGDWQINEDVTRATSA